MKLSELKEQLKNLPDDAEVTYGKYQGFYHANRKPCLIISQGNEDYFIDIPNYGGLPRGIVDRGGVKSESSSSG